jgi:hypothetical protein
MQVDIIGQSRLFEGNYYGAAVAFSLFSAVGYDVARQLGLPTLDSCLFQTLT